ncbi:hypothetical protein CTRI78_v002602 [Colletotrichum trifolii]|uniref:Uncharacterized protein n=1 Tax=Colletotrichum trifolii TaxID=5466 RepID=A0A4R8RLM1_COLTR|nr:hypothetical protein CTRI78_v002602 [Colletotrichum trifolii]
MRLGMPSLKGMSRFWLCLIVGALLVDVCQARDKGLKLKRQETSKAPITSEIPNGRVVTSIVTTYILVTLPCGVSELPPSISSLLPSQSGSSLLSSQSVVPTVGINTTKLLNGSTLPASHQLSIPISIPISWSNTWTSSRRSGVSNLSPISNSTQVIATSQVGQVGSSTTTTLSFGASSASQATPNSSSITVSGVVPPKSSGEQTFPGNNSPSSGLALQSTTSPVSNGAPASESGRSTSFPVSTSAGSSSAISLQGGGSSTVAIQSSGVAPSSSQTVAQNTSKPAGTTSKSLVAAPSLSSATDDQTSASSTAQSSGESQGTTAKADGSTSATTQENGAIPTSASPSSAQPASSSPAITSAATAVPGSSGAGAPSTTPGSSTTEEPPDYTVLPWFATITPPPGVEPTTSVTWSSSDYKTSTRRDDGVIVPIIVPVWVCGVAQILCHPKCIIPFISCDISGPGPLGFPWAKPPPSPPKPKPKPGNPDDPSDPDDPEPSQTQTTSSETSCTATSTISPYCDQRCDVRPYTTEGSTHAWSTVCHTATCQPTVVQCSQTVDKTTTTTYSTVSAEPTEVFCGDPGGFCMDCAKKPPKPKLKPRQVDDLDVLSGPEGLTHPGTWPLGPDDWFRRMYYNVGDYCEGLGAPRTLSDGQTVEMGYSTMNADDFGDEPIMGGTGPLWGCRALLIITRHGIYTSHNWEVPNFSKGSTNLPIDPDEEFKQGIEEFLKSGDRTHHPYVGVDYLKQNYRIFNSKPVKVFIINPSTLRGAWWEVGPPSKAESDLKKPDSVRRWKRYMKNTLGWSEGKGKGKTEYETLAYNQGPGQWPAWRDNPDLPRNRPMDYYEPPWGMVHWQYHPQHIETVKGKKVRRAALRVWYESHLIWETSWKLEAAPPGSPSASAPIWKASGSAVPSAGQPHTRTSSAGGPIVLPTSPTNQTLNTTATPIGQSGQPSKSKGSVVIVTATAETTITKTRMWLPGSTVRVPDPKPIGPVKRAVRLTEQVTMNESKHSHTATVDIYEVDAAGKENLLTSVKDSGGGEVQLPSVMNIADLKGGTLKVDFVASQFDINFEWSLGDLTLQWSNSASKNEEGGPWCENPDADKVSENFKRVVNCFWEA